MSEELTSARQAERQAERLRADLAGTLDQLSDNLAPSRLASEAAIVARDRTLPWLKSFGLIAAGPVGLGLVGATAASVALHLLTQRRRP